VRAGQHEPAARIIEQALGKRYDADLVAQWPELANIAGRKRIAAAEAWLQRWGEQAAVLVALGRLCAAESLWGKAEEFLLRAERKGRDPAAQTLLGYLCERHERPDEAARWYREAALTALGEEGERLILPRKVQTLALPDGDDARDGKHGLQGSGELRAEPAPSVEPVADALPVSRDERRSSSAY
jgi:HemY protein